VKKKAQKALQISVRTAMIPPSGVTLVVDAKIRKRQGFAVMSPELRRQISSQGGTAAHRKGTAHRWTKEEAQAAGRKGGAAHSRRRAKAPPNE
jgi:uncharacterized protein